MSDYDDDHDRVVPAWRHASRHPLVLSMLAVSIISAILDLLDTDHVAVPLKLLGSSTALYLSWLLIAAPIVVLIGSFTKGAIEACMLELAGWVPIALVFLSVVVTEIARTPVWYEVGSGVWFNIAITAGAAARVIQLTRIAASWTGRETP